MTNDHGLTALNLMCKCGRTNVEELSIQNATEFKINLIARDKKVLTPFNLAYYKNHSKFL